MLAALLAAAALAAGLAGCGLTGGGSGSGDGCGGAVLGATPACTHAPSAPPGGIAQDAAIAAAKRAVPSIGDAQVVGANAGSDNWFAAPVSTDHPWVWVVRLAGPVTASPCPSDYLDHPASPSDPACLDGEGGVNVVLDYFTGALLGFGH